MVEVLKRGMEMTEGFKVEKFKIQAVFFYFLISFTDIRSIYPTINAFKVISSVFWRFFFF